MLHINIWSAIRFLLARRIALDLCPFAQDIPKETWNVRFLPMAVVCASACLSAMPVSAVQAASFDTQPSVQAAGNEVNAADLPAAELTTQGTPTDASTDFWTRPNMLGEMGGLRTALGGSGVTLGLTEISEILYNTRGGFKRGAAYHGLVTLTLGLDTEKVFGLYGGSLNASVLNIHGRTLSPSYLGVVQTASGVEANRGTRLWELWYQQKFADDKIDVKAGQQSLDQEFMASQYAGTFINAAFGWPALPSADLPAGGPAYPLSSLGVRLRARVNDSLTVLGGVYDGNPAGTNAGDPQVANAHGTNFNLHNRALYIAELQYAIHQPVPSGQPDTEPKESGPQTGLPGTYKLGAWYNSQLFADQRYGSNGLSLADPASNGNPALHKGNYSIYAVADQMVWRQTEDGRRALGAFARAMVAPGDRNLIGMSAIVGLTLTAPFKGRDNDVVGLGLARAKVGTGTRGLDRDSGANQVRSTETIAEATYLVQVAPWWQLQADVQYVRNPGAGQSSKDATHRLGNERVWGLRTNITF
jgi:porin